MKRFILFTFSILLTFTVAIAQDGINYQGAATDVNGDELTNQNISIRASVLSTSANGNLEWEETHSTTTDQFGLFNLVIGQGTNSANGATANFDDIDWGSGNHFLKIEMDATGGTNYAMIGTTQMMSVPYALYAKSAGIDSTMLANMIGSSGGGMGGGCNFKYPDGLDGDPITSSCHYSSPYIVPMNKRLIVLGTDASVEVNGSIIFSTVDNGQLMILNSGDYLSSVTGTGYLNFNGFLIEPNPSVTPITSSCHYSSPYIVPMNKRLIVLGTEASVEVNGSIIFSTVDNGELMILNSGDYLSSVTGTGYLNFNGYLVDENYFANCGGGGASSGSSASNATIDSLSQVVSNLDSSLTALTSQFNFGCNDPTACNYDATANFNDGSCILPDGCTDPNAINYDATAICDDGSCVTAIGQYYQGGIIAYIDGTGLHGLIVSPDIGNASWGCYGTNLPGADGTAIGTGNQNTIDIINGCPSTTAASLCGDLVLNGYSDWHLPSKDELYQLYLNSVAAGIPSTATHWSSSEGDATGAWVQIFSNGSQQNGSKGNVYPVIAVRQF